MWPLKREMRFHFETFSDRQLEVVTWWKTKTGSKCDGIICDGAVRSGKTLSMSLSFVIWAMANFDGHIFTMSGKTIASFRRNVLFALRNALVASGYVVQERKYDNLVIIKQGERENFFYIFGGQDEASQDLIQGITSAGAFFDEVALMPESFVNQAVARCSVTGSKFWFNCNPSMPAHWFKKNWIDDRERKNLLYRHFVFDDNPSLSEEVKERYKRDFRGVFAQRYIQGLWVAAEGAVYPMFDQNMHVVKDVNVIRSFGIGCDVGYSNATAFVAIGIGADNRAYAVDEYYHSGRDMEQTRSPLSYARDYLDFKKKIEDTYKGAAFDGVFIDPSALGFMQQLREQGEYMTYKGNNEVVPGIQTCQSVIDSDLFRVLPRCQHLIDELGSYRWDDKAAARGEDAPIKDKDHLMDAMRYFFHTRRRDWVGRRIVRTA